jgi:hypothetical protein
VEYSAELGTVRDSEERNIKRGKREKERAWELMSHTELNLERHESAFYRNAFSSREIHCSIKIPQLRGN